MPLIIDWDGLKQDATEHDAKLYIQVICPRCLGGPDEDIGEEYKCADCRNTGRLERWVPFTAIIDNLKEITGL